MTQEEKRKVSYHELANRIFHEHYDAYIKELDIFSATLLAKRNSLLYVRTIIDKIESDGVNKNQDDYFYFINTKLELELI
jgi:hypothetical protein